MQAPAPSLILAAAFGAFILSLFFRVMRWRTGKASSPSMHGILDAPRRYLVHVHAKVIRRRNVGLLHILTALGFISLSLVSVATLLADQTGVFWGLLAVLSSLSASLGALLFLSIRIRAQVIARDHFWNATSLILFSSFFGYAAASRAFNLSSSDHVFVATAWTLLGAAAAIHVFARLGSGPLRHAFAGYVHLSFHPRQERFQGTASAPKPPPSDFESLHLGVATVSDFAWNRLVGFDACVQCRRCEEVCPAHAAGTALNPMSLITNLRLAERDRPLIGVAVSEDALWSCTTCNACVEACPMFIEHVDAVIDLRRFQTMELARTPNATAWIENLTSFGQGAGKSSIERLSWAADLNLRRLSPGDQCGLLLWVGDAGFSPQGRQTLRALLRLLKLAECEVAVLPDEEDVGDIALRLGDEKLFRDLAKANATRLDQVKFEQILTIDPHVLQAFAGDYQAIGRTWPVVHHSTFLERLILDGRLGPRRHQPKQVTYHDPCYLGRVNGIYEAPRNVIDSTGSKHLDMVRNRATSFCCGYGGGAALLDAPQAARIPDLRLQQAHDTGAEILAVACPNCAVMLSGSASNALRVMDIAELLLQSVEAST